jgi:hypothetical protein
VPGQNAKAHGFYRESDIIDSDAIKKDSGNGGELAPAIISKDNIWHIYARVRCSFHAERLRRQKRFPLVSRLPEYGPAETAFET